MIIIIIIIEVKDNQITNDKNVLSELESMVRIKIIAHKIHIRQALLLSLKGHPLQN